jgi:hypothetical protein
VGSLFKNTSWIYFTQTIDYFLHQCRLTIHSPSLHFTMVVLTIVCSVFTHNIPLHLLSGTRLVTSKLRWLFAGTRIHSSTNRSTERCHISEHNTNCHFPELSPFLHRQPLLDITVGELADVTVAYATTEISYSIFGSLTVIF